MSQPPSGERPGDEDPEHAADAQPGPGYPYAPQPWGPPDGPPTPRPEDRQAPPQQPSPSPADYSTGAYGPAGYPPAGPSYPPAGSYAGGYGAPGGGYGPPGAGYGYAGGGMAPAPQSPEHRSARTQGIVSLVLNILSVFTCCNLLGIVGAVLAGVSLGRIDSDLPQAKNLIRWSWVLFGVGLGLVVLGGLAYLAFFVVASSGTGGF